MASTRPKQWSHPPAYLREDDVEHVGRRQTVQYQEPNAAQYTQGLEDRHHSMTLEGATRRTPRSSRSASPLSQHADYVTLDEWKHLQITVTSSAWSVLSPRLQRHQGLYNSFLHPYIGLGRSLNLQGHKQCIIADLWGFHLMSSLHRVLILMVLLPSVSFPWSPLKLLLGNLTCLLLQSLCFNNLFRVVVRLFTGITLHLSPTCRNRMIIAEM